MELPIHPLLTLVERNANCLKLMLTHYIDATVDNQFASLKDSIETMIATGQIGPHQNHDVTAVGITSPPPTLANTDQSSAQCSHEYSNDTLTRAQKHQNTLKNDVALANTINTDDQMIKQEFDDDNIMHCENCEKGICTSVRENYDNTSGNDAETREHSDEHFVSRHNVHTPLESQSIIQNCDFPNSTNPINTDPIIKQECLQASSITISLNVNNNIVQNDIAIDEPIEGQNKHIQTVDFDDNEEVDDDDDYSEDGENEYLNNRNCGDCPNGVCDLGHENNNNLLTNFVLVGDEDETDIETNFDEAQSQIDISVTNNTQMNIKNDEENVINERSVSERDMEQSTPSISGVRSLTRKRIQTKVFADLVQSNVNHRKCAKRKSAQANKSEKKVKRKQILDDGEDTDSDNNDDKEDHANNEIGEEIATESTTNPMQPNLPLQCSHCHKTFDHQSELLRHLRVHTGEHPFQCFLCNKIFRLLGNLTQHQLIHQNIKRFRCHVCDKQFTHKHRLDSHLRTHSGERPFACRLCEKSFASSDTRNTHEQAIHLHVKSYRCKQCGHTAVQLSTIIRHIRVVHFGLPKSIKQQRALNIIDERDPRELLEKV